MHITDVGLLYTLPRFYDDTHASQLSANMCALISIERMASGDLRNQFGDLLLPSPAERKGSSVRMDRPGPSIRYGDRCRNAMQAQVGLASAPTQSDVRNTYPEG